MDSSRTHYAWYPSPGRLIRHLFVIGHFILITSGAKSASTTAFAGSTVMSCGWFYLVCDGGVSYSGSARPGNSPVRPKTVDAPLPPAPQIGLFAGQMQDTKDGLEGLRGGGE